MNYILINGIVTKGILICNLFYYYYQDAKYHVLILYIALVTLVSVKRVTI